MENLFTKFKKEIIKRAKYSGSCKTEFKRAVDSNDFNELTKVITDNFYYCCNYKIIDCKLLSTVGQEICNENNLFYNISTDRGFLISDSATVIASDSATVIASDSVYIC